jgi:hypothetical protein
MKCLGRNVSDALIGRSCSSSYGHTWHCVIRLRLLIQGLRSMILMYLVCGCGAHGKLTDFFLKKSNIAFDWLYAHPLGFLN